MITEDYVSFEIAKLLKEKGFDSEDIGELGGFYSERCYEHGRGVKTQSGQEVGIVYDDLTNSELDYDEYLRPTLQMAMKWLREVHKWSIQVFPVFDNLKWCYDIYELKIQKYHDRPELLSDVDYDTYEEACEAAIKYCLENLI